MASAACPALRALEIFPTQIEGQRVLCLRDPSGLSDRLAFLPPTAAMLLSFCDGRRGVADVAREFRARTGRDVTEASIRQLLGELDEGLFLDTPRFHAHRLAVHEEFRASPTRAAAHAGKSYPGEGAALAALLDSLLGERADGELPDGELPDGELPVGVVAPHIDFPRGGAVYGAAYRPLAGARERPDLVVVFGTDHNGADQPFTLTRKDYQTPLGTLKTDVALVDGVTRELGAAEALLADEFHHRTEHSIEFQAVWLSHVFGDAAPPLFPVLCGGLLDCVESGRSPLDDPRATAFLGALCHLTRGRRVLVVAGADLAHVGPRFGDAPQRDAERAELERADRAALEAAQACDARGFFASVAKDKDRRRVCGLVPITMTLALLGETAPRGHVLAYDQCPADEAETSFVSIAAMGFPR